MVSTSAATQGDLINTRTRYVACTKLAEQLQHIQSTDNVGCSSCDLIPVHCSPYIKDVFVYAFHKVVHVNYQKVAIEILSLQTTVESLNTIVEFLLVNATDLQSKANESDGIDSPIIHVQKILGQMHQLSQPKLQLISQASPLGRGSPLTLTELK